MNVFSGNSGRYLADATNTSTSMMNRVRSFLGKSKNRLVSAASGLGVKEASNSYYGPTSSNAWLITAFGIVFAFFLFLVFYNKTVGTYVSNGFKRLHELIYGGTDIKVDIDPGLTGTPLISVDVTDHTEKLPQLTSSLLPEPVTVSTPHDEPPKDSIQIPPEDRPAGMPGAEITTSLGGSLVGSSSIGGDDGSSNIFAESEEVFNVSQNVYTFNDAAAVCAAAGSKLATYEQVKEAYEKGADWCNYGWIKGQMAVYPTQKETYEKLQMGAPEWRNACGIPGVNGGYFDNPELRFGVNCYGIKPTQKASDTVLDSQVSLPQTPAEIEFEKRVQRFRDQMDTAAILPFTKGQWNQ